jgi:RNase H-fold protein (predicted Holliday junction resolvase)
LGMMVECPIDMVDEHYTTVMAQEILWDYSKQKWFDDCIAAMQIVERYLRIISQD